MERSYVPMVFFCMVLISCSGGLEHGGVFVRTHYIPPNTLSGLGQFGLPQNSDSVSITITGTDFMPIVKQVRVAASPSGTTIDGIPAGTNRTVSVEVRDASSITIARGKTAGVRINAGGVNDVDILITQTSVYLTQLTSKVIPRAFAMSVPLPDGTYLIMGGVTDQQSSCGQRCSRLPATSATEIYRPDTGTFMQGPRMTEARVLFTASRLSDGSIMVTGGTDALHIDCSTGTCSISTPPDGTKTSIEVYDPKSNSFYKAGTMAVPRAGHTADVLSGDAVLIAGGIGPDGPTGEAELMELKTSKDTLYAMSAARAFHASATYADGAVFLAGGSSCGSTEIFQASVTALSEGPVEKSGPGVPSLLAGFTSVSSIAFTTSFLSSILLPPDDDVLVNGGFAPGWVPVSGLTIVSPVRQIVLGYYSMSLPRALFSDIPIGNGSVLVAGGVTTSVFTVTSSAEVFSTVSKSFT
ncbi:MAG: hypothetical protein M1517_04755, partial [Deltaproteobacteria bacterium]|nr:hypothetical protein [Deltaproteobacteria bacterium]